MTAQEIFELLALKYADKPDDFRLSIGHMAAPNPDDPITIFNLPEFQAHMSITMAEVRAWAKGAESK